MPSPFYRRSQEEIDLLTQLHKEGRPLNGTRDSVAVELRKLQTKRGQPYTPLSNDEAQYWVKKGGDPGPKPQPAVSRPKPAPPQPKRPGIFEGVGNAMVATARQNQRATEGQAGAVRWLGEKAVEATRLQDQLNPNKNKKVVPQAMKAAGAIGKEVLKREMAHGVLGGGAAFSNPKMTELKSTVNPKYKKDIETIRREMQKRGLYDPNDTGFPLSVQMGPTAIATSVADLDQFWRETKGKTWGEKIQNNPGGAALIVLGVAGGVADTVGAATHISKLSKANAAAREAHLAEETMLPAWRHLDAQGLPKPTQAAEKAIPSRIPRPSRAKVAEAERIAASLEKKAARVKNPVTRKQLLERAEAFRPKPVEEATVGEVPPSPMVSKPANPPAKGTRKPPARVEVPPPLDTNHIDDPLHDLIEPEALAPSEPTSSSVWKDPKTGKEAWQMTPEEYFEEAYVGGKRKTYETDSEAVREVIGEYTPEMEARDRRVAQIHNQEARQSLNYQRYRNIDVPEHLRKNKEIPGGKSYLPFEIEYPEHYVASKKSGIFPDRAALIAENHKQIVKKAILEGKPVPPEVLDNYPDLAQIATGAADEAPPLHPQEALSPPETSALSPKDKSTLDRLLTRLDRGEEITPSALSDLHHLVNHPEVSDDLRTHLHTKLKDHFGLELMDIKPGESSFDNQLHQSYRGTEVETNDKHLNGKIAEVIQPGVVRAADNSIHQKAEVRVFRYKPNSTGLSSEALSPPEPQTVATEASVSGVKQPHNLTFDEYAAAHIEKHFQDYPETTLQEYDEFYPLNDIKHEWGNEIYEKVAKEGYVPSAQVLDDLHTNAPKVFDRLFHDYPSAIPEGYANPQARNAPGIWGDEGLPDTMAAPMDELGAPPGPLATPRISPSAIPGGERKNLSEIVLDLSKSTGNKVRVGKTERGSKGVYYAKSGKTVIKYAGDLDTSAHEVAHALDDLHGLVSDWAKPRLRSPFDSELLSEPFQQTIRKSYPLAQRRAEGVAEWIRAYVVNPDEAKAAAPNFYKHFITKVPDETLEKLDAFSRDVREWKGLSNTDQTLSNVRTEIEPVPLVQRAREAVRGQGYTFETTAVDRLKSQVLDDLYPVMKGINAAKEERGIDNLLPMNDPEVLIRTHSGAIDKVQNIIEEGPVDAANQRVAGLEGGFKTLLSPFDQSSTEALKADMNDTIAYMISQRVVDEAEKIAAAGGNPRRARISGAGGGLDTDYDKALLTLQDMTNDPIKYAKVEEGARLYREWSDWQLRYLRDKGRISSEDYARIVADNPYYVDMHRVMEDAGIPLPAPSRRRLGSVQQTTQRFTGSSREIDNPYVNLMEQTYKIVQEADRNEALRAFRDLLVGDRHMYDGQVQFLANIGAKGKSGDANAIKIFVDGKPEYWQFEKGIHQALKGWGEVSDSNVLTALAGSMRGLITHSPDFLVRNIIRDTVHRSIISEVGSTPFDIFKGGSADDTSALQLFGGGQAGHYIQNKVEYHRVLSQTVKELAQDERNIIAFPQQLGRKYEALTKQSEMVNRLAEYRRAKQYALNVLKYDEANASKFAAEKARGLMDFAVAGSFIRKVNRYIPFTNASIQGLRRTALAAHKNPYPFIGKFITTVLAPTLAVYAYNAAQGPEVMEEYRQQPDYIRDLFWSFKVGPDTWVRIPKPFEVGVFASGVDRAIDAAQGIKGSFEGYGGSVKKSLIPVDESAIAGPLRPVVETLANYDFFREKSIVSPFENDLDLEKRKGNESASSVAQILQNLSHDFMRMDARKIDHLITSFGGGIGRTALNLSDVGRADKGRNPIAMWGNSATGLLTSSPVYASKDVQHDLRRAKGLGKSGTREVKDLQETLSLYYNARTNLERDARGREVRLKAKQLRSKVDEWEQKSKTLRNALGGF